MDTYEPPIFELSSPGKIGAHLPDLDVPEAELPTALMRGDDLATMPELTEPEVIRHFTRISQRNMCIDTVMYPLGSCTMKYNPKIHEEAARLPGFAGAHPLQGEELSQGALRLMYELQRDLAEISGFDAVSLQPAAGAQGELTGILVFRAITMIAAILTATRYLFLTRLTAPTRRQRRWSATKWSKSRAMRTATSILTTFRASCHRALPA